MTSKTPPIASRRRGDELEDAILEAAWEALLAGGYHGFTYEAVAERAGTSRPVLYRRWPDREGMLLATLEKFWRARRIVVPDTGSLREDAIGCLKSADLGRARTMTLLGVQILDYFRDSGSSFRELRAKLRPPGEATGFETLVARAVARGEIVDVPRSERIVNLPLDLLRHEVFMTMRAVPDGVVLEIVDDVWLPLLGAGARMRSKRKPRAR